MNILYNITWLRHLQLQNQAKKWAKLGLITKEEEANILATYPVGFYMPTKWVTFGLFIFTLILLLAIAGLVTVLFTSNNISVEGTLRILLFIFSFACFFMTEYYKKNKHYFHAGTDDALLWAGLATGISAMATVFFEIVTAELAPIPTFLFGFVLCLFTAYRYLDKVIALTTVLFWFLFLFFLSAALGKTVKALLPFIACANGIVLYFLSKRGTKSEKGIYLRDCLLVAEASALLIAYLSVNYFVVRELSALMFDNISEEGKEIPFAFLFYFFTVSVPLAYVILGLRRKDSVLLRIGLLLIAVAILTIRYYHSLLPIETALTIGGLFLIAFSYFSIRWLKKVPYGFTYEEQGSSSLGVAESLMVVQTFGKGPHSSSNGPKLGGGDFGGAGATEGY